jgi:alpha-tubulin suppressor-like RCC1 family protein
LGINSIQNTNSPVLLNINFQVSQISLGENHTLLIDNKGATYSCGMNFFGQLGLNNNYVNAISPTKFYDFASNVFAGVTNSFLSTNTYSCNG